MNEETVETPDGTVVFESELNPSLALALWQSDLEWFRRSPEKVASNAGPLDNPELLQMRLTGLLPMFEQASVVLWDSNLYGTAVKNANAVFDGIALDEADVPKKPEVWVFSETLTWDERVWDALQVPEHRRELSALVVYPAEDGRNRGRRCVRLMYLLAVRRPAEGIEAIPADALVPMVRVLPLWGVGEVAPSGLYQAFVAARRFMSLPITCVEEVEPELNHAQRKPYKRAGILVPSVRVVTLRKREAEHAEESDRQAVRFKCHFLVGGLVGHWRKGKQFLDGRVGAPEFVSPYVKGDKSKPFRPPSSTVYKVVRRTKWNRRVRG